MILCRLIPQSSIGLLKCPGQINSNTVTLGGWCHMKCSLIHVGVNQLDFVEESNDTVQTTDRSTILTGLWNSKAHGKYDVVIDSLTFM